jgi:TetR/AcrR family transcriptional regulator, transcriptional repressor for nem operon
VNPRPHEPSATGGARGKLLDAAIALIREKGYAATSVDELCARAGVTKGAFFHHFPTKDALGVIAASYWADISDAAFAAADYQRIDDPLERLLGYLDFRKQMLRGSIEEFSCFAGTLVQETYGTHPDLRRACEATMNRHLEQVTGDITAAMQRYKIRASWTAESLALHTQAVLQGAFIMAKAKGDARVAEECVEHLRRYVVSLFDVQKFKRSRKE